MIINGYDIGVLNNKDINLKVNQNKNLLKNIQNTSSSDKLCLTKPNNVISFTGNNFAYRQTAKTIHFISFSSLEDPGKNEPIGIQMRVTGVKAHQKNIIVKDGQEVQKKDRNGFVILEPTTINRLAKSDWEDGDKVDFKVKRIPAGDTTIESGALSIQGYGEIGRVPDQIYPKLNNYLTNKKYAKDFHFELSNVIAGTTKGAPTIGLRVNLKYNGKDPVLKGEVQNLFNTILNDDNCKKKVMHYQPKTSPEDILKIILKHEEEKTQSPESAQQMQSAIDNIVKEIDNPANKKILLVGHSKPDGDTLGCILGFKNAIEMKHPNILSKQVDCAVDDKVTGLFRHKLPGIDGQVKRVIDPEREEKLKNIMGNLQDKPENEMVNSQIEILQDELQEMDNVKKHGNNLKLNEKYDVVVLFDIATPERFSGSFKRYMDDAKKVIYVDHHPHRIDEWRATKDYTGVDIDKIRKDNLFWVADAVPAATEQVAVLASKMMPVLNQLGEGKKSAAKIFPTQDIQDKFRAFVASIVTGMSTDTGAFTRTANLLPEHMVIPVQQRPNFMPEGLAKWLMASTNTFADKKIDKKWIHDEITYDIIDAKIPKLPLTARETMLKYSISGHDPMAVISAENLGLGIIQIDYDQMFDVWQLARKSEKNEGKIAETNLLDVQNAFKYGEVMNVFRTNPTEHGEDEAEAEDPRLSKLEKLAKEDYISSFDNDRIAVLIMQDKKKGCLDEKLNMSEVNGLRLSFRSEDGSKWAEMLALMFNGGGHGGASGGRVNIPDIDFKTKLAVQINGRIERDPAVVCKKLDKNHEILNDYTKNEDQKSKEMSSFKVVKDDKGVPCDELIKGVVREIRAEQTKEREEASAAAQAEMLAKQNKKSEKSAN